MNNINHTIEQTIETEIIVRNTLRILPKKHVKHLANHIFIPESFRFGFPDFIENIAYRFKNLEKDIKDITRNNVTISFKSTAPFWLSIDHDKIFFLLLESVNHI